MAQDKTILGVRSVQIALDVLEAVAFADEEIGVSEIASRLDLAKGAVHRHLQTLATRGYLVQSATTSRYQVGIKFQLLGRLGRRQTNLFTASEASMIELRNAVGETVVLSAIEPDGARVLATVPGTTTVEIGVRAGSILPFGESAQGKVMLAFGTDENRARFGRTVDEKIRVKTDRDVARAYRQGWLESPGEVMRGINAIAAPIFDASSKCTGTIAIVGLFDISPRGRNDKMIAKLKSVAERISTNLGFRRATANRNDDIKMLSLQPTRRRTVV